MFEERVHLKNKINPESMQPHNISRPDLDTSVEYEDTPEFRKSLNMEVNVVLLKIVHKALHTHIQLCLPFQGACQRSYSEET